MKIQTFSAILSGLPEDDSKQKEKIVLLKDIAIIFEMSSQQVILLSISEYLLKYHDYRKTCWSEGLIVKFLKIKRISMGLLLLLLISVFLAADKSALMNRGSLFAESIEKKADRGKDINILIMGIDARPGEMTARSDTMILASIHPTIHKAVLIWIPRDTRLDTPVKGSYKINSVNFFKGPEATCNVVGKMFDVDVDHYIMVNFNGFENIIDKLGGLDMDVDINLHSARSNIHLVKGRQHLNGREALKYVRFRIAPRADIARTERQQKLVSALIEKLSEPATMIRIPLLLPELSKNVDTNIAFQDLIFLSQMKYLLDTNNIYTQTLPGYGYNDRYSGASYWIIDPQLTPSVIKSVLYGHRYEMEDKN